MTGVNPVVLYYDVLLCLAMLLTGVYLFMWRKHFDAHITLVFVMVPVICLGYVMLAHSSGLAEALAANRIIYMCGCFLQLIVLLVVCNLCDIHLGWTGRILKTLAYAVSAVVFIYVMNPMQSGDFYRHVELEFVNGLPVLRKEYGWMHTAFQVLVIFFYLLTIALILYSFAKKNQISRKILGLLFFPESLAVIVFFLGRKISGNLELLPAVYVIAQVNYLVIVSRVSLYDITDTAVDSLVRNGDTGFISIDFGGHYLGSNETARDIFPILRKLTVDRSVRRRKSFSDLVTPWLEAYRADRTKNTADYGKDDKIYRVTISPLYNGRRERGYQLTVTDNTADQMRIHFQEFLNRRLQEEIDKATQHIRELNDKMIVDMAVMIESRDNSTGGHVRRTKEGVRILLDQMPESEFPELTESVRTAFIKAAPMHDLGKIAVDDEILRKPGRFTPEEYEKMKEHAAKGGIMVHKVLKDSDDELLHVIAETIAQFHHERWDGKGYPDGLTGEDIPLEARIMAVADVYDALVSKRVYKERMSFEKADQIMMEGMGTQFAPEMKDVYCRARPQLEQFYLEEEKREEEEPKGEEEKDVILNAVKDRIYTTE